MRVTDAAASRQYLYNMNASLSNKLDHFNKAMTGRSYTRASQDSINANRAMKIRKDLANLDMYDTNLKASSELFSAAESSLYEIADNIFIGVDTLVTSIQDTKTDVECNAIALDLEEKAKEMVSAMNVDFGGRQIFGGTSNNKEPFTIKYFMVNPDGSFKMRDVKDEDGNPILDEDLNPVQERIEVTEAEHGLPQSRAVVYFNGTELNSQKDPRQYKGGEKGIYVDIGLGIDYNADLSVKPETALDISLNGAKLTGCGVDDEGDSLSIIQLTFDAAFAASSIYAERPQGTDAEREENVRLIDKYKSDVNKYIDKLQDAQKRVLDGITRMGVTQNSIDFYLSKNEDYRYNLKEDQNDAEYVDYFEEITEYQAADAAYQAALKMGGKAVPLSLFDFI